MTRFLGRKWPHLAAVSAVCVLGAYLAGASGSWRVTALIWVVAAGPLWWLVHVRDRAREGEHEAERRAFIREWNERGRL